MNQIADITLETLLGNKQIRAAYFEDDWYFCKDDLNDQYGDSFRLMDALPLPLKSPKRRKVLMSCKFSDIAEQVEHFKKLPPFGTGIDALFQS